jgi:thiamine-monophosphate kinase
MHRSDHSVRRRFSALRCSLYSGLVVPISEKALISRIRRASIRHSGVALGIGDDCAILRLPAGHEILVTTDFNLEGIHFRREWHPPAPVGHRCLTRGLSDIAAMGGEPIAAFLSLAAPANLPQTWIGNFTHGLLALAENFKITLAGGDTAESPAGILVDIVVVGSVPRGKAVLRSGAKPGDRVYVTGDLGGSAAALGELRAGEKSRPADYPRHFFPIPRVAVGRALRERGLASAMIDVSDGLSTDLAHICEESGVGAEILAPAIPRAFVGRKRKVVDLFHALHGGEDYELLFTAPPGRRVPNRIADVAITFIGNVIRDQHVTLISETGRRHKLRPQGWEHFRR